MKRKTIIIVIASLVILSILPFVSLKISGMAIRDVSAGSVLNALLMVLSFAIITAFVILMVKENRVQ